jgi:hypothetical protein
VAVLGFEFDLVSLTGPLQLGCLAPCFGSISCRNSYVPQTGQAISNMSAIWAPLNSVVACRYSPRSQRLVASPCSGFFGQAIFAVLGRTSKSRDGTQSLRGELQSDCKIVTGVSQFFLPGLLIVAPWAPINCPNHAVVAKQREVLDCAVTPRCMCAANGGIVCRPSNQIALTLTN